MGKIVKVAKIEPYVESRIFRFFLARHSSGPIGDDHSLYSARTTWTREMPLEGSIEDYHALILSKDGRCAMSGCRDMTV